MAEVKAGLQDVVIAASEICSIDGAKGILTYRGYDIHDLAAHSSFEEVVYLLWNGRLPKRAELAELEKQLTENRAIPAELIDLLKRLPPPQHPMETLRTAVSALSLYDPEAEDMSMEANRRKALRLTAQMGTLVAAFGRIREGKEPVTPDPNLNSAANFLYMLKGQAPNAEDARWFDVALILHADHSFNASTFAARVTASTLSDLHSAITSALGTLKGPLHGGANEQVMKMLLAVQTEAKAEDVSQRAYARLRGVALSAVQKAIATKRITPNPDGSIDPERANQEWERNTFAGKTLHQATRPQGAPRSAPAPSRGGPSMQSQPDVSSDPVAAYLRARAVTETFKAKTAQLEFEERAGKLIQATKAGEYAAHWSAIIGDALSAFADRVTPLVAAANSEAEIHRILTGETNAMRRKTAKAISDAGY